MRRSFALLALATVAFVAPSVQAQTYTLKDIGLLSGTAYNFPRAISNNPAGAEIVGVSRVASGSGRNVTYVNGHAFYWSQASGIVDIGVLGADVSSLMQDINNNGEVVGASYATHSAPSARPVYWSLARQTAGLGLLALPTLGGVNGRAYGINGAGTIVGQATDGAGVWWGVVWTKGVTGYGAPTRLLRLDGSLGGLPTGINTAGVITGQSLGTDGLNHACLWTPDASGSYGAPTDLGVPVASAGNVNQGLFLNDSAQVVAYSDLGQFFAGAGGVTSILNLNSPATGASVFMTGLNDAGQAAGSAPKGTATHAILWQGGVSVDLGTLGGTNSYALSSYDAKVNPVYTGFSINLDGTVVGHSQTTGNKSLHAFVYAGGVMKNLNNLAPNKLSFTELRDASVINNAGVIAGSGLLKSGLTRTYVAIPN